jgi:hypothetical protein
VSQCAQSVSQASPAVKASWLLQLDGSSQLKSSSNSGCCMLFLCKSDGWLHLRLLICMHAVRLQMPPGMDLL